MLLQPSTAWPPAPHREQRVTRERHCDLVRPMTWHLVQRRTEPAKADTRWGVQAVHTSVGRVQPSKVMRTALEGSPLRFFSRKTKRHAVPVRQQIGLDLFGGRGETRTVYTKRRPQKSGPALAPQ